MLLVSDSQPNPLAEAIDTRRQELGYHRWRDLADAASISVETLHQIRKRTDPPTTRQMPAEHRLETALQWTRGTMQALREHRPLPTADESPVDYPDIANDATLRAIWDLDELDEEERKGAIIGVRIVREQRRGGAQSERSTA